METPMIRSSHHFLKIYLLGVVIGTLVISCFGLPINSLNEGLTVLCVSFILAIFWPIWLIGGVGHVLSH